MPDDETTGTSFLGTTWQVALVTPDLEATLDGLLLAGLGPFTLHTLDADVLTDGTLHGEPAAYSFRYALAQSAGTVWEIIQPLEGASIYAEFLEANPGGGLQHVAVDCNGIPYDEAVAGLLDRGYTMVQSGTSYGDIRFAYFSSGSTGAPIVEVVEIPPDFAIEDITEGWYPTR